MPFFHPKTLLDKTYEAGIVIKGIDGTFELIGGIAVLVLSPALITRWTDSLTANTLRHDPHSLWARHVAAWGASLASGHNLYAALFLLTHGLVKVVLVTCLLLNKLWAYPWALGALSLFLIFQLITFVRKPSFGMGFLCALDALIIWLVYREWQKVKRDDDKDKAAA